MNRALALLVLLCAALSPACAQTPAPPQFQPEQLRGFARDTLVIQRSNGRDQFSIWLAETPEQQQQGLMWIQQLPRDYGMLFLLPQPRPMSMWMKNTYVPLDMVFFDSKGRILRIHEHAVPLSEAIIDSGVEVAGVLEILAGEAKRRGMQVGDQLLHARLGR
ncbi:MAG TPA: DUF192 domain-containing protein [Steroidobacteraceae bacterium]|nr:DUF192 domain-containing protein [Steroidobacteraceae bacterium]